MPTESSAQSAVVTQTMTDTSANNHGRSPFHISTYTTGGKGQFVIDNQQHHLADHLPTCSSHIHGNEHCTVR